MITSTSNAKIKHVAGLVASAKQRRAERVFIVEGERIAGEIPESMIKECYVSEDYISSGAPLPNVDYETVSDQVFRKMSDTKSPQGILCLVKMPEYSVDDFLKRYESGRLKLLILESIQDPGNLGTMVRTCEAAGFDGIIANDSTVDIYNPKVIRSTMGGIFRVPVMYSGNLVDILDRLKETNVKICAAHLNGKSDFTNVKYSNRTAVLIGNEGNGLSDSISEKSDILVRIPMEGKVESLNAAVAASLMMFEVKR